MHCYISGLGSCAFARHYLRNHFCFLFLRVLRCFSSPGSPHHSMVSTNVDGLPHSEIRASRDICSSARLIAACHVLLRLREPRHPSCALLSFPFFSRKSSLFTLFGCPYKSSESLCLSLSPPSPSQACLAAAGTGSGGGALGACFRILSTFTFFTFARV